MADTFAGTGIRSITACLSPMGSGWTEVPADQRFTMGFPLRAFLHRSGLFVMSAVETVSDEDKGPEYHLSITKQVNGKPIRCDSNAAKWVLEQFGLDGAEEDNHVPFGMVRNFWRAVATGMIGLECKCKAEEPAIREDKGDFVWRP
jgi:hypothetical protein